MVSLSSFFNTKKGVIYERFRTIKTRVKRNKRQNWPYRRKIKVTKNSRTKDIKTRHSKKKKRKNS